VILVTYGVWVAWNAEEPKPPSLKTAVGQNAPKPAPEPLLDVVVHVVDDETGKPVERFGLQGGMRHEGKMTWGYSMQSPSNYPKGRMTHRFSGKIGQEQHLRIIADGYLPEPIPGMVVGQPPIEDLEVRLSRGGTVRGKILDHEGKPAAGATIYLAGAQPVSLRDGKPEYFAGTKTTTDAKGVFRMRGVSKEGGTLVVVAPSVRPWPVEVKNVDEELEVKLPEAGKLRVKYDIEGAAKEGLIHLHIKAWEMPGWKGIDSMARPKVTNGGEVLIDHLAPGTYDLARYVEAGRSGFFCDRTTVIVEAGKTAEAEFVRKEGTAVRGRVTGLDENEKIESATVRVIPDDAKVKEDRFPPTVDVVALVDGKFKTSRLLPGNYVVQVDVFLPEPPNQRGRLGMRGPDYTGRQTVSVPASGEGPEIVVEVVGRKKPEAAKKAGAEQSAREGLGE
jgi:hypothetical protein